MVRERKRCVLSWRYSFVGAAHTGRLPRRGNPAKGGSSQQKVGYNIREEARFRVAHAPWSLASIPLHRRPTVLCVVTEMAQVDAFTTAHEVMARGAELNGLKVFIPKTFFHEDLLPPRQQKSMLG